MVGVGEHDFYVVAAEVYDRIERVSAEVCLEQVEQAVAAEEALAVEGERQAGVEIGVVVEHGTDVLHAEAEVAEELAVGQELDEGAVGLRGVVGILLVLADDVSALEVYLHAAAVADTGHDTLLAEGVDGLEADTVEAHGLLEVLVVELAAGVDYGGHVDDLAEGYASAVVADADAAGKLVETDVDALAGVHVELVDGVVYDLLEEDINAIVSVRAVTELADVHARAEADVLLVAKVTDRLLVVCAGAGADGQLLGLYCVALCGIFVVGSLCHCCQLAAKIQKFSDSAVIASPPATSGQVTYSTL